MSFNEYLKEALESKSSFVTVGADEDMFMIADIRVNELKEYLSQYGIEIDGEIKKKDVPTGIHKFDAYISFPITSKAYNGRVPPETIVKIKNELLQNKDISDVQINEYNMEIAFNEADVIDFYD